jgi:hypothetical protein
MAGATGIDESLFASFSSVDLAVLSFLLPLEMGAEGVVCISPSVLTTSGLETAGFSFCDFPSLATRAPFCAVVTGVPTALPFGLFEADEDGRCRPFSTLD